MKTQKEITEKIDTLNNKIAGMKAEDEKNLTNELKVILAGTELQSIILSGIVNNNEETIRQLLKRFEDRSVELNEKYEQASGENNAQMKNKIHAMVWTNDIRMDTLKWVLEEDSEGI